MKTDISVSLKNFNEMGYSNVFNIVSDYEYKRFFGYYEITNNTDIGKTHRLVRELVLASQGKLNLDRLFIYVDTISRENYQSHYNVLLSLKHFITINRLIREVDNYAETLGLI